MEKILTGRDRCVIPLDTAGQSQAKNISNFGIRTAGQIGKDQERALSGILETEYLARSR
jgi:hypothetical protein